MFSSHTDEMQSSRQDVLTQFLLTLSTLLELYQGPHRQCHQHPDCDALALGKLEQSLKSAGLLPVPEPLSLTSSIQELFSTIRAINLPTLCGKSAKKPRRIHSFSDNEEPSTACHLDEKLQDSLSSIEGSLHGLNISGGSRKEEI